MKHIKGQFTLTDKRIRPHDLEMFSKKLRSFLHGKMSNRSIARAIPCSLPTVRKWSTGKKVPPLPIVARLATILKTNVLRLIGGTVLEDMWVESAKKELVDAVPALRTPVTTAPALTQLPSVSLDDALVDVKKGLIEMQSLVGKFVSVVSNLEQQVRDRLKAPKVDVEAIKSQLNNLQKLLS